MRVLHGLCDTCIRAGKVGLPPRPRRPYTGRCEVEGCALNLRKKSRFCCKHATNPHACLARGCAVSAVADGRCEKHRPGSRVCTVNRCLDRRYRGILCRYHYERRNLPRCTRPDCDNVATVGDYCRIHDVGIDFAAGDWHDWAAVQQLWEGRLDPDRRPTMPELEELFDRAERYGMGVTTLSRQVNVDERLLNTWRMTLGRIERVGAEVAA